MERKSEENVSGEIEKLSIESDGTDASPNRLLFKRKADEMQEYDSGRGTDKDVNITNTSEHEYLDAEMLEDSQLKEKQFKFLKKYFDRLRTYKPMCNWYERYGESTTLKPPQLEDFPCECHLENNSTKKVKEEIPDEVNTTENQGTSKSEAYPLTGHNKTCNIIRLNLYFIEIAKYFCSDALDINIFLFDEDSYFPVDYEKKKIRLKRKTAILVMRDGLDECLDECLEKWSESMSDQETEEWRNRNKVRVYVCSILNNMLDNMIDPSPSESSEYEADDDPIEKVEYRELKAEYLEYEDTIEEEIQLRKLERQNILLAGRLKELKMRMDINSYPNPLVITIEDSGSGSEKSRSPQSKSSENGDSDINMENPE